MMSTAFLSPNANAIDNSTLINAYLGQCNESMPIQSPLEVYRANIRLAQLIIEMLGINELQYAYKLASSLGHHIVSRLAQGCGTQEETKHQDRFDYLNVNTLPNQSYSTSGMMTLQQTPLNQPDISSSAFHRFGWAVPQPPSMNVWANTDSRPVEQTNNLGCRVIRRSAVVSPVGKPIPNLTQLLNEESSFPAQEESKTTTMMREGAIDLTMKQVITESIEDSQNAHTTDRVTSTLDLDENASNTSHVMRSHKVRCKPPARARVIGSRKPRLTSRPGSNKQTRRRATRANSSGECTISKRMNLRRRPIQRRYVYDSPDGSPSTTELSTSMIPCTSISINSASTISAPLMPQTVYEKSNPETNINTNLSERNSFSINQLRNNLEYRTLMANQYSTPYAMNPTARHQMCYTCCIRLKNPLEFVKHIQQVHLGLSVPEMKMPKTDLTETNWSTYKNNSNNTVSSSVESQPQFDHVKSEM